LLLFSSITFAISKLFVKKSLSELWKLSDALQDIDIDTLEKPITVSGPPDDEIRIIADRLQQSFSTIKQQTDALKDFVAYASHELKTPLMAMATSLSLAEKTQNFDHLITSQKSQISHMQGLFEQLLDITQKEFTPDNLKNIDLVPFLQQAVSTIKSQYPTKQIFVDHPLVLKKISQKNLFTSIMSNLITNACNHSPDDAIITVTLTDSSLKVHNT
jgi:signal transduction histidine kinase